jgi:hypothetical protein
MEPLSRELELCPQFPQPGTIRGALVEGTGVVSSVPTARYDSWGPCILGMYSQFASCEVMHGYADLP